MEQKVVVVTGATSGIGLAIVILLLKRGYSVIGVGSKATSVAKAKTILETKFTDPRCDFVYADLSSLRQTRAIAGEIANLIETKFSGCMYALINNAGGVNLKRTLTEEGHEFQFALNHLSGFLLSFLLLKYLHDGKIIFTTSRSHRWMKIYWRDVMLKRSYNILKAYKQSKLANVMTAKAFKSHFAQYGIRTFAVDPGLVNTDIGNKRNFGLAEWIWNQRKLKGTEPMIPAKTYVYLLESAEATGLVYKDEREISHNVHADNDNEVERLFRLSADLVGVDITEHV